MAPSATINPAEAQNSGITADVTAAGVKGTSKHIEVNDTTERPPVADDYMYDFKYNHALPTIDVLGTEIPQNCDAQVEAAGIVKQLSDALGARNPEAFANIFLEYGKINA